MGSAVSANIVFEDYDHNQFKQKLGPLFDEKLFDSLKNEDGVVTGKLLKKFGEQFLPTGEENSKPYLKANYLGSDLSLADALLIVNLIMVNERKMFIEYMEPVLRQVCSDELAFSLIDFEKLFDMTKTNGVYAIEKENNDSYYVSCSPQRNVIFVNENALPVVAGDGSRSDPTYMTRVLFILLALLHAICNMQLKLLASSGNAANDLTHLPSDIRLLLYSFSKCDSLPNCGDGAEEALLGGLIECVDGSVMVLNKGSDTSPRLVPADRIISIVKQLLRWAENKHEITASDSLRGLMETIHYDTLPVYIQLAESKPHQKTPRRRRFTMRDDIFSELDALQTGVCVDSPNVPRTRRLEGKSRSRGTKR